MPLRNFFEALGRFFEWTFDLVMPVGPYLNWVFGLLMAGFGIYWLMLMRKHARNGEK